eukprot:XP_011678950.1 PREDICTED: pancreatic triacylglycerol lipase [Strongylocentrotus purpuratus]
MGSLSLAVVFLAAAIIQGCQAESVQYDDLDRLYYGSGAPACHHSKPESPSAIVIRYWLYTKQNKNSAQELKRKVSSSITNSNFQSSRGTKFIIHGYTDDYKASWAQSMKNALVDKNMNVIMVDWEVGAGRVNYAQSRANTRVVGQDIGKLIDVLKSKGASYGSMHIIGHSLGAHTAGYAGESRSGIGRLTDWKMESHKITLNKIKYFFSLTLQLGHQDFYPNGGESQPGCAGTSIAAACDHMRAVYLFTESVYSSCNFSPTKKCTNWSSYPNCNNCGTCPEMGYGALKSKGQGAYYLTTNSKSPYCK